MVGFEFMMQELLKIRQRSVFSAYRSKSVIKNNKSKSLTEKSRVSAKHRKQVVYVKTHLTEV